MIIRAESLSFLCDDAEAIATSLIDLRFGGFEILLEEFGVQSDIGERRLEFMRHLIHKNSPVVPLPAYHANNLDTAESRDL